MKSAGSIVALGLIIFALGFAVQREVADKQLPTSSQQELVDESREPAVLEHSTERTTKPRGKRQPFVSQIDDTASEHGLAFIEMLENGGPKIVPYSDISAETWSKIYGERRKLGHFRLEDIALAGYDSYDQETVTALAQTGDALAEFIVVSSVSDYPEEVRREVALSAAMNGRTFGLFSFGTEPFDNLVTEAHFQGLRDPATLFAEMQESEVERLVEGFGMMTAALRLGDSLPVGEGSAYQTALSILSPEQRVASNDYAVKLANAVRQQLID